MKDIIWLCRRHGIFIWFLAKVRLFAVCLQALQSERVNKPTLTKLVNKGVVTSCPGPLLY